VHVFAFSHASPSCSGREEVVASKVDCCACFRFLSCQSRWTAHLMNLWFVVNNSENIESERSRAACSCDSGVRDLLKVGRPHYIIVCVSVLLRPFFETPQSI